jgi:hypothetical protein
MASIQLKADRVNAHKWFAWHPVVAVKKGPQGHTYHLVWLRQVQRKFVNAMGIGQWTYEIA